MNLRNGVLTRHTCWVLQSGMIFFSAVSEASFTRTVINALALLLTKARVIIDPIAMHPLDPRLIFERRRRDLKLGGHHLSKAG